MCGICGKIYFDAERPVESEVLWAMCQSIKHRGPDETGTYVRGPVAMGSTRLSIIDLEGGHMPLSNEDGTVWIVYNGEVYNFQKLRERLESSGHRFRTRSDTETIVHLYEEEGEDFACHLNGMFALAIWDQRKQRLLLARDHLGIKPLFYAQLDDRLLFASEIKALLADGMERQVDRLALHDYLSLNYVPGPHTMLKGVRKLQPGHILVFHPATRQVDVRPYWDLPRLEKAPKNNVPSNLENELLKLLRTAVHETMISDVPVGAFLSGGIDSSLVVALMSEVSSQPIKTFSVGFQERSYSELPYAKVVAQRFQTDHHELVLQARAHDLVAAMADYFDEPFADNSALAVFAVSQLAARQVKVVLSGDGGDEVFGGYYTYQADKLASLYRRLPRVLGERWLPGLVALLPTSFEKASFDFKIKRFVNGAYLPPLPAHYEWKAYLDEEMKFKLYCNGTNGYHAELRPTVSLLQSYYDSYPTDDLLNRLLYVDSKVQLVDDMLTKVDRMSMAHSLEVRVPLLDQRLVHFMACLPSQYKVRGLTLKHLLKRVARGLLPAEILRRPKAGFTIPVARWLATDLRDLLIDQLSPSRIKGRGLFEPEAVMAMLNAHWKGQRDFSRSIWTLLMFDLWCDRYLKQDQPTAAIPGSRSVVCA